jgi:hypothetical protein
MTPLRKQNNLEPRSGAERSSSDHSLHPCAGAPYVRDGDRQPSENELDGARFQGRHVAETAKALLHGRGEAMLASSSKIS